MLQNPQSDHERYVGTYVIPTLHGVDPTAGPPPMVARPAGRRSRAIVSLRALPPTHGVTARKETLGAVTGASVQVARGAGPVAAGRWGHPDPRNGG